MAAKRSILATTTLAGARAVAISSAARLGSPAASSVSARRRYCSATKAAPLSRAAAATTARAGARGNEIENNASGESGRVRTPIVLTTQTAETTRRDGTPRLHAAKIPHVQIGKSATR